MHELESTLKRLYLMPSGASVEDGQTRAMVIGFPKTADGDDAQHWANLCVVANALQADLGLPAPAVSINGSDAYGLWLSLASPVPVAQAQSFVERVCKAYAPGTKPLADAASAPHDLPPFLNANTGKWAAFIHPGLGASFADEPGLEMAPPMTGQLAFLEDVRSISDAQFTHALNLLQPSQDQTASASPARTAPPDDLLLCDATLEDIVRHLHSKNIEPTFRHVLRPLNPP